MPYDPRMTAPMREELTRVGFGASDRRRREGRAPLLIAAARPDRAARDPHVAVHPRRRPARDRVRRPGHRGHGEGAQLLRRQPPSSPQVAILSGGRSLFLLQRQEIEGRSAPEIAARLIGLERRPLALRAGAAALALAAVVAGCRRESSVGPAVVGALVALRRSELVVWFSWVIRPGFLFFHEIFRREARAIPIPGVLSTRRRSDGRSRSTGRG